ncbi:hypothetical protein HZC31_07075 [Candidatus Woesearchaeota archaeon]|nr:hypothetical protein [Candidatus Woesearchaeota archaeon]
MEKINLEDVLGCKPERTYLGGGYLEDICCFRDLHFSFEGKPQLSATLHFEYSALANSSEGFHLSAMNVQFLVPYLCAELIAAVLEKNGRKLLSTRLLRSQQKYSQYIQEPHSINFRVTMEKESQTCFSLRYEITAPMENKNAFSGTMVFDAASNGGTDGYSLPTLFTPIICKEQYALDDIFYNDKQIKARMTREGSHFLERHHAHNGRFPSATIIHGALGQLSRALFCGLFGFDRQKIIKALAYKAQHTYHHACFDDKEAIMDVAASDEVVIVGRHGVQYALITTTYTLHDTNTQYARTQYASGALYVACPMPSMTPEQQRNVHAKFSVRQ